ncbi:MAG: histidine phosphatase family protein [Lachnospiraceae bacterium]
MEAAESDIILTLIRHGKTKGNEEQRYIGLRTDEGLSQVGRQEILEKISKGVYPQADIVLISPMLRCRQTAQLIYPDKNFMEVPAWREMDFGEFEGKNYLELSGNSQYQRWIDSGGVLPFPGGEAQADLIERCMEGFKEQIEQWKRARAEHSLDRPLKVSAVIHGGTIMALLSQLTQGNYFDYSCRNGGGYQCCLKLLKNEKQEDVRGSLSCHLTGVY